MKKTILATILNLIFLIIFNVVFFSFKGLHNPASVWISYVFIHFAYIVLVCTPLLVRNSASASIFGFALGYVSSVYFLVNLLFGIVIIIFHPAGFKFALIAHFVIFAAYAVVMLVNMIANEHTADSEAKHEMELQYVRESSMMLKNIMESTDDRALQKNIEKAYDVLHASQVKSSRSVREYELNVIELIEQLQENVNNGDSDSANNTIRQIIRNAEERNRLLRYNA